MSAISDLPPLEAGEKKIKYLCEPMNKFQRKMRNGSKSFNRT